MDTPLVNDSEREAISREYTRRLHHVIQLQVLTSWAAIFAFGYFGWCSAVADLGRRYTANVPTVIAICFVALSVIWMTLALPFWFYAFNLQQEVDVARVPRVKAFRKTLKRGIFDLFLLGIFVEIVFSTHVYHLAVPWLWASALCSIVYWCEVRSHIWIVSLFHSVTSVRDEALGRRIGQLAIKAGVRIAAVCQVQLSEETVQANAWACGPGRARQLLLSDTLINALSSDELDAMVAHELGHCAHHDVAKRVGAQCLMFALILFTIDKLIEYGGLPNLWSGAENVPWFLLAWSIPLTWAAVAVAALARRQERAADLFAWRLIDRVEPFITAIQKISNINRVSFDKESEWQYSHPLTGDRLARAAEYAKALGQKLSICVPEVPPRAPASVRVKRKLLSLAQATLVALGMLVAITGAAVWFVSPEHFWVALGVVLLGTSLVLPVPIHAIIAKRRKRQVPHSIPISASTP